ncbi:MAG: hypothetical protein KDK48_04940, partial [Chlamydiia bacterium]|nr:hypothetical protein [Chlamydiia bacterium]
MGRIFAVTSLILFMLIGVAALFKTKKPSEEPIVINQPVKLSAPLQIALQESEPEVIEPVQPTPAEAKKKLEEPVTASWPLTSVG